MNRVFLITFGITMAVLNFGLYFIFRDTAKLHGLVQLSMGLIGVAALGIGLVRKR